VGGPTQLSGMFVLRLLTKSFVKVQVIGEQSKWVETTLTEFKMAVGNVAYQLSVRFLLRLSCSSILRDLLIFL